MLSVFDRCRHLEKALAEATSRIQELDATNSSLEKKLVSNFFHVISFRFILWFSLLTPAVMFVCTDSIGEEI